MSSLITAWHILNGVEKRLGSVDTGGGGTPGPDYFLTLPVTLPATFV